MSHHVRAGIAVMVYLLQRLAIATVAMTALALSAYAVACALGSAPWLTLQMQFGSYVIPDAGMLVQLGVTAVALTLLFYMPSHARMMALETSHRNFHMSMRDVARAYSAAHRADREGVFTLSSEFDSVRERIAFLRAHPDLDTLEADVMELAAQMSHISRELAHTYSDNNVTRARDFLVQRQEDIAEFEDRVKLAKQVAEELTHWRRRVELEESVALSQLDQLRAELSDILPELTAAPAEPEPLILDETMTEPTETAPVAAEGEEPPRPDLNDERGLYADDDRIVALLARRAGN